MSGKVLDQSVFHGAHPKWKCAVVNSEGHGMLLEHPPRYLTKTVPKPIWHTIGDVEWLICLYDASNWKDSMIIRERDSSTAQANPLQVRFKKIRPDAKVPVRATDGAAGFDLHSTKRIDVPAGQRMLLPTGIACAIPEGWCGQVWPRSGLAVKHGIDRLAGLIDSDYRGELHVSLVNHGQDTWEVKEGERIAQLVFVQVLTAAIEVDDLDDTARGAGGFGSTGK